jgi:DNA-directed RNA polymerase subunit RPC12/RpoP
MSERKVISKYYPPDFDPSVLPRRMGEKASQTKIRMMIPMSIRCQVCGEYMGQGKKFNARKETVEGETYLGLKVFRFYIRCTRCSSELTFKTDPKNSTYVADINCVRNFEPWRDSEDVKELPSDDEGEDGDVDAIQLLEARTLEMKAEMDAIDDLDELKSLSAQKDQVNLEELISRRKQDKHVQQPENDFTEKELAEIEQFQNQVQDSSSVLLQPETTVQRDQKPQQTVNDKKRKREDSSDILGDIVLVQKKQKTNKSKKKKKISLVSY